jgi:hypothetical protein
MDDFTSFLNEQSKRPTAPSREEDTLTSLLGNDRHTLSK